MPIFEYRCQSCEHKFEKLVFGQSTQIDCPECGSDSAEKLFSTFGFKSSGVFSDSSGKSGSCDSCHTHNCSSCSCH